MWFFFLLYYLSFCFFCQNSNITVYLYRLACIFNLMTLCWSGCLWLISLRDCDFVTVLVGMSICLSLYNFVMSETWPCSGLNLYNNNVLFIPSNFWDIFTYFFSFMLRFVFVRFSSHTFIVVVGYHLYSLSACMFLYALSI